jgi:hypothetical protein
MPEGSESLRELLQGFNSMQMSLGLLPGGSPATNQTPTPPPVKHPGQISQEMMQIATQQIAEQSTQIQRIQQLPAPGVMGLLPAAAPAPPAAGEYSRQFRGRMEEIESRYLEPFQAQQMARQGGQPGFQMMPSPVFQTAPSMGIYRPTPQPAAPVNMMPPGGTQPQPIFPMPFQAQPPPAQFATPFQQQHQLRQIQAEQDFAEGMAAIPTAAYMGTGTLTAAVGMGLGGRAGGNLARMGGGGARAMRMGRFGGRIGGIAAGAAAGFGMLGFGAERGAEMALEPAIETRGFGRQLQDISQQFVVGGPDMSPAGRGLSTRAAIRTASQMQQGVEKNQMSGFNMRDIMGITQQAADQGMLDMAQNSSQITQQVRNVARGLKAFMQIAQEPDVKQAMSMMGQMRTMGLTIPETNIAMRNASQFARMAGVDTKEAIAQGGLPGAMTFQRMGMSAGLGLQVGTAAMGMARQGVAGGAFTPGQLAMAGGQAGVTQTMTEAAGAGLGIDFPILSMLGRNQQGQLQIDPGRAERVMSGQMSLSQQATEGAQNLQRLGGERVIMELSTRMNEIRDQLGRQLGPQGSVLLALRQATNTMKEVPGLSLGGALRMIGMDPQQARTMEVMGQSPQFWKGLQTQHQVNIREARAEESQRRERIRETSDLSSRVGRWYDQRGWTDRLREMGRGVRESVAQWRSDVDEGREAAEEGQYYVRQSRQLQVQDKRMQQAVNKFMESPGYERFMQRNQAAFRRTEGERGEIRGTEQSVGDTAMGIWNTMQMQGRMVASVLPMTSAYSAVAEATGVAGLTTIEGGATDPLVQAQRTMGGFSGKMAEWFPNLVQAQHTTMLSGRMRSKMIQQAESAAEAGFALTRGEQMSGEEVLRTSKKVNQALREEFRDVGMGSDTPEKLRLETAAVDAIIGEFRDASSFLGDKAVTDEVMKKAVIQSYVAKGVPEEKANKIVNRQWKEGLRDTLMSRVSAEAPQDAQAAIAKTKEAQGFTGFQAGASLEDTIERAERVEADTQENLGMNRGINLSEEQWKEFTETLATTDTDELMLMQVLAMKEGQDYGGVSGSGAMAKKEAGVIEAELEAKLGPEKMRKLRSKVGRRVQRMTDTQREALVRSGSRTSRMGGYNEQKDFLDKAKGNVLGTRAVQQVGMGVAKMREQGFGAFESMAEDTGDQGVMKTLEALAKDTSQLEQLKRRNPAMGRMVEEFAKAGSEEERLKIAGKFRKQTGIRGQAEGGTARLGGRGVGSAREAREEEAMGREAEIQAAIEGGRPEEAFARSIPQFNKASTKLLETSEKMDSMIKALSIGFTFPGMY